MTESQVKDTFFDMIDDLEADVAPSGFDLVGKCIVQFGWSVFAAGVAVPQEDHWFPFSPGQDEAHKAERKAARDMALTAISDNGWVNKKGEKASPIGCLAFIMPKKDELTGRLSEWKTEARWDTVLLGVQGWTDITKPSLIRFKEVGIDNPFVGACYLHLSFAKDPTGRTNKGQDGRVYDAKIPYVVTVLKSKEDAEKYVADHDLASHKSSSAPKVAERTFPENYTAKSWKEIQGDIKKALETQPADQVASDYEIGIEWVEKVKAA